MHSRVTRCLSVCQVWPSRQISSLQDWFVDKLWQWEKVYLKWEYMRHSRVARCLSVSKVWPKSIVVLTDFNVLDWFVDTIWQKEWQKKSRSDHAAPHFLLLKLGITFFLLVLLLFAFSSLSHVLFSGFSQSFAPFMASCPGYTVASLPASAAASSPLFWHKFETFSGFFVGRLVGSNGFRIELLMGEIPHAFRVLANLLKCRDFWARINTCGSWRLCSCIPRISRIVLFCFGLRFGFAFLPSPCDAPSRRQCTKSFKLFVACPPLMHILLK